MAKSKKSKILASMLAVSTMAVFYAAPVMAGDGSIQAGTNVGGIKITIDREDFGQDGTADSGNYMYYHYDGALGSQSKVSGQLFISSENIAEALKGQDVTFGAVTADTISAASGAFEVNSEGIVDAASFNATTGDISTTRYSLNTVGADLDTVEEKTAAMYHTTVNGQHLTTISGKVVAGDVTMQNGNITTTGTLVAREVANSSGVTLSNLDNAVDTLNTSVAGVTTDITDLQNKTQNMSAGRNYTTFRGSLSTEGSISSGNGAVQLRGNWGQEAAIDLRDTNNNYATLTATQLANINNVVQENGNVVANSLNVANGAFEVTNDGTVNGPGNFTIYNNGVMYAPDGGTIGGVIFNNDGSVAGTHFSIAANGEITATNFNAGSYNLVEVGNDLTALQGTVDGTTADITALEQKTAGISKSGPVTTVEGVDFTQGHMDADYVLTDGLKVNGISDLDGVQVHNGTIYAENDSYVGGVQLADGLVNGVNMDNLRGIERVDYGNGVGETTIEGATTFDQGGMGVYTDTGSSIVGGGNVVITDNSGSFTQIMGGDITAETLNGKNIDEMFNTVTETNANVGGIKRVDSNGDGTLDTTTIEDTLSVSSDQVLAQTGSSQLVLTEDVAGLSSGNASFALTNNELQLSVAGNGLLVNQFGTNLNGTVNFIGHDNKSYTLSDLEGRVYDLEQKTQNITSADPGQGGGSEVPPTGEGHTGFEGDVTVGGDINADEGNFNKVNTDEITVGDSTFIDGDSVNSNEGNFKDKVTVGGEGGTSITGDGMTVGTADKGTTVSDSGVSIKNEYGSVETGVVDGKNDVVVTDEDGNRTSLVDTAGRVDNLEQGVAELNNRVGELEDRIDKVGAMAAAIANLRTMGYDPAAPTEVAVGIGQYRDETGAALGLFHYPNRDFMLSLSVSTSGDEVMGGIGATWKFGRKSPEKVAEIKKAQAEADARRAEETKLAKAEEMKQAAKEAKIKAQQERHAILAAERAAQAEAAK